MTHAHTSSATPLEGVKLPKRVRYGCHPSALADLEGIRAQKARNAQRPLHNILRLENESEAGMLGLRELEQQFAFKDLMIHLILQFTLHIAFRGVLHRCGNQEIHR